jgi:hypothetical protein
MGKAGIKKKTPERSNVSYMHKLVKKSGTSARGSVTNELNKMLTFLIENMNGNMATVLNRYAKKDDTVKAKLVQAAMKVMLTEDLRDDACEAGAAALVRFLEANKLKSAARGKSKGADEPRAEAEPVSA